MLAPETRPISQEQLVAEVKGIYAGLVMVESRCIEVDNAQSSQNDPAHKLTNEQWMALIDLHRTTFEHHDFFLASMALKRLANKYAMPARMWRHGTPSFLELLRHRLPGSLEHMLSFIYLAYSMMALLYETVPTFEDTSASPTLYSLDMPEHPICKTEQGIYIVCWFLGPKLRWLC